MFLHFQDYFAQSVSPSGLIRDPDPPTPSDSADPSGSPTPTDSPNNDGDDAGGPSVGLIAGVVVGAVVALALIVGLILFWRRRKSRKNAPRVQVDLSGPQGVYSDSHGSSSIRANLMTPDSDGVVHGVSISHPLLVYSCWRYEYIDRTTGHITVRIWKQWVPRRRNTLWEQRTFLWHSK